MLFLAADLLVVATAVRLALVAPLRGGLDRLLAAAVLAATQVAASVLIAGGRRTPASRARPAMAMPPTTANGSWAAPIHTSLWRNTATQANSSSTLEGNDAE